LLTNFNELEGHDVTGFLNINPKAAEGTTQRKGVYQMGEGRSPSGCDTLPIIDVLEAQEKGRKEKAALTLTGLLMEGVKTPDDN